MERHTDKRTRHRFAMDFPATYYADCITNGTAHFIMPQNTTRSHWVVPITDEWAAVLVYDEARSTPVTVLRLEWYKNRAPQKVLQDWLEHKAKLADPAYREDRTQWAAAWLDQRCKKRVASGLSFVRRFRWRKG
jgi:hypothetical protein